MQAGINIPKCEFDLFNQSVLELIMKANRMKLVNHPFSRELDIVAMMANYQMYFLTDTRELVNVLVAHLNYGYQLVEPEDVPFDLVGMTYYINNHVTRKAGEQRHWMLELKTHSIKKAFDALLAKVVEVEAA